MFIPFIILYLDSLDSIIKVSSMKIKEWQLQHAKNRLSEVINNAMKGEPQMITRNGQPAAYIINCETFDNKIKGQKKSKKEILLSRPHKEIELNIERDPDPGREIEL